MLRLLTTLEDNELQEIGKLFGASEDNINDLIREVHDFREKNPSLLVQANISLSSLIKRMDDRTDLTDEDKMVLGLAKAVRDAINKTSIVDQTKTSPEGTELPETGTRTEPDPILTSSDSFNTNVDTEEEFDNISSVE